MAPNDSKDDVGGVGTESSDVTKLRMSMSKRVRPRLMVQTYP